MYAAVKARSKRAKILFGMVIAADQQMEQLAGGPMCGRMVGLR
jgi:hypothetical protein